MFFQSSSDWLINRPINCFHSFLGNADVGSEDDVESIRLGNERSGFSPATELANASYIRPLTVSQLNIVKLASDATL